MAVCASVRVCVCPCLSQTVTTRCCLCLCCACVYVVVVVVSMWSVFVCFSIVRGEIHGFVTDELPRKHLPRMFSLIENEGQEIDISFLILWLVVQGRS